MYVADSQVEKQPTTTHAESGTAHADAEVATKVDGTPAAVSEPEVEATKETEVTKATPATEAEAEGSKTAAAEESKDKKVAVKVSSQPRYRQQLTK
jgi:hypothetical protein